MNNEFFEKSKEIANEFLQSIVFLDDQAFSKNTDTNDNKHSFDALEISKAFAKQKKVCAVYQPKEPSDIDDFNQISKKADVVILDWYIPIQENVSPENSTQDVESDEPRGQYTKQIISELVNNVGCDSLKLIIIYTGDDILDDITNDIATLLGLSNHTKVCEIEKENIKIFVRSKANVKERFKNRHHLQDKVLKYEELPNFILEEFTKMTLGLLSNFALLSLTTIRNNSHKLLGLFSKDLDAAYLGHKMLLPNQEDAEDLLVKLLGDSIADLLYYGSIPQKIQSELIENWIAKNIEEEDFSVKNRVGVEYNPNVTFKKTQQFLKTLLSSEETEVEKRIKKQLNELIPDKKQRGYFVEHLFKNSTSLFVNNNDSEIENRDKKFAILTHHKSIFISKEPILTLGTLIKHSANDVYFVCIQQRCDSVRIPKDEERKFLFLPLTISDDSKFHIITSDGIKLKLNKKSYAVKTIKFKCNCEAGVIAGTPEGGKYIFKENYDNGNTFEWILDLKDLHAQRIVANYTSQLSRVGLDESEWLRIAGN